MNLDRRAVLLALASAPLTLRVARAASAPIRIGVLRFGTVSWELDVIRRHALDQAQGVTSGGWGNCASGGETWFQPINEILNRYGLTLHTA